LQSKTKVMGKTIRRNRHDEGYKEGNPRNKKNHTFKCKCSYCKCSKKSRSLKRKAKEDVFEGIQEFNESTS